MCLGHWTMNAENTSLTLQALIVHKIKWNHVKTMTTTSTVVAMLSKVIVVVFLNDVQSFSPLLLSVEFPSHCACSPDPFTQKRLNENLWEQPVKNLPFAPPPVRTLPDHKTFSSLPNGCCRPHLSICTDQKHSQPRPTPSGLNRHNFQIPILSKKN